MTTPGPAGGADLTSTEISGSAVPGTDSPAPPAPGQGPAPAAPAGVASTPSYPKFCRKCGAALRPNVHFCPHCGNPIGALTGPAPQATMGGMLAAAATAPPRRGWFARLPPVGKITLLVISAVFVGAFIQALLPSQPKCLYSCRLVTGPLQPAGEPYSNGLFSFDYPPSFTQGKNVQGSTVAFSTSDGPVVVWSGRGQVSLQAEVNQVAQKMTTTVQNMTYLGPMWGAEIGFVPGLGQFYSGQAETESGEEIPVGVGIVAAQSGGTWATMGVITVCTNAQNGSQEGCSESLLQSQQEDFGNAQAYDSVLAHWRWDG